MKRLFLLLTLLVPTYAHAEIPLDRVTVLGSDPAVLKFPTNGTRFDAIGFDGQTMFISTVGTSQWPAVAIEPGGEPVQAGTLWVFEEINGQWYATGAERLRPSQLNGGKPEGEPGYLIGGGWLYDVGRWGPMAGFNPRHGAHVGFMIAAGSTRSDNQTPLKVRTPVIEVLWSATPQNPLQIVWTEGEPPVVVPPIEPPPVVVPPIVVPPPVVTPPPVVEPPVVTPPPVEPPPTPPVPGKSGPWWVYVILAVFAALGVKVGAF